MRKDKNSSNKKFRLARLATTFSYALLVGAVLYLPHTQSLNPTSQVMGDDNLLMLKAVAKDAGSDSDGIGTFVLHIQHIYMLVSTLFFPAPLASISLIRAPAFHFKVYFYLIAF